MDKHQNVASNLNMIRKAMGMSMSEFSKELGVPKSTIQSILEGGQMTLYTALLISERLKVPIDILTGTSLTTEKLEFLAGFMASFEWFSSLNEDGQKVVANCIKTTMEVIVK